MRQVEMSTLTINSTRFGALQVPAESVIEFPAGLIGLRGRRYVPIATDAVNPFHWLQSLDDADLAVPVTDPWRFFPDYEVELPPEEAERAAVADADAVAVWVTVRAADELGEFTANLRAPILVAHGHGHQVVNASAAAPVRARLFPDAPAQQAA
jgi:flagellar assembly factor FliW